MRFDIQTAVNDFCILIVMFYIQLEYEILSSLQPQLLKKCGLAEFKSCHAISGLSGHLSFKSAIAVSIFWILKSCIERETVA